MITDADFRELTVKVEDEQERLRGLSNTIRYCEIVKIANALFGKGHVPPSAIKFLTDLFS